jgi:hypothetical protein
MSKQQPTSAKAESKSVTTSTQSRLLQSSWGDRALLQQSEPAEAPPILHEVLSSPASASNSLIIQPKLTIGPVGDKYEQEADRIAEQVVKQINAPQFFQQGEAIQRQDNDEDDKLQMKPASQNASASIPASPELESAIERSRSGGQLLTENIRTPMEREFGADFTSDREHTDGQASWGQRQIQVEDHTTKLDFDLRHGAFDPGSGRGKATITQELTHVIHQGGGAVRRSPFQTQRLQQHPASEHPSEFVSDKEREAKGAMRCDRQSTSVEQRLNKNGLPEALKVGVESLSGYSLEKVRVHYNSPKPALFQALAYTQGIEIHVAAGQEKQLPHEAWHVVQQMQGRVKATMHVKGKQINNDDGLEHEADAMGNRAVQRPVNTNLHQRGLVNKIAPNEVVQTAKKGAKGGGRKAGKGKEETTEGMELEANTKEKEAAKKKALLAIVERANDSLEAVGRCTVRFEADATMTSMNPAVFIRGMPTIAEVRESKEQARLTNFSAMVKEHVNKQPGKQSPEVQTAIVNDVIRKAKKIYLSGNSAQANSRIGVEGGVDLETYYRNIIRPIAVTVRARGWSKAARKYYTVDKGTKTKTLNKKQRPNLLKRMKTTAGKSIEDRFARVLREDNKRSVQRRQAKSARNFATAHKGLSVRVPPNAGNIHAESAILSHVKTKVDKQIEAIGGTKVACLACQAYFTHERQHHLLGDNTGYAWISEASIAQMKQLDHTIDGAECYLKRLAEALDNRMQELKRYTGQYGDKNPGAAESEEDLTQSDSEDEEAQQMAMQRPEVKDIVEMIENDGEF